jgi:hypothetical protein
MSQPVLVCPILGSGSPSSMVSLELRTGIACGKRSGACAQSPIYLGLLWGILMRLCGVLNIFLAVIDLIVKCLFSGKLLMIVTW